MNHTSSQTSSPSYLLLASLDGARATLAAQNAAAADAQGQRFQAAVRALRERVLLSACLSVMVPLTVRWVPTLQLLGSTTCRHRRCCAGVSC